MSTHNLCFEQEYEKYQFLSENFPFLVVKFSIYMYLNRRIFIMQGLINPLPSCPEQVQILAGKGIFLFHLFRKMYRIYREYCNSEPFSRGCGMLGKWLKPGFVRPCNE